MVDSERAAKPGAGFFDAGKVIEELHHASLDYQEKMARYLMKMANLDGLEDLAGKGALPSLFFKLFAKALKLYDESAQFVLGRLRHRGFRVRCRMECPHCCHNMPSGVSTVELVYLYHAMHERRFVGPFFRRCLEAEESWVAVCRDYRNREAAAGQQANQREALLREYLGAHHPCPFLRNRLCQIYPCRPLSCRMHFALSPPHWCHTRHFQNPYAVGFNLEPGGKVQMALDRLDRRFQLDLSDIMVCGLLELTVNVMRFEEIQRV